MVSKVSAMFVQQKLRLMNFCLLKLTERKKRAVKNLKVQNTKVHRSQVPQVLIIIRDLVMIVISGAEVVRAMGDTAVVVGINQRTIQVTIKKKMFMTL